MSAQEGVRPADDEANRYLRRNILRSEAMYGHGFQSPGGLEAVRGFCRKLQMRPGMKILEIGSGLGGSAFYFAKQYAATVVGLDISKEMIEITNERKKVLGLSTVSFQQGDIRTAPLEKDSFDLAWTRDCVLYIEEKSIVWKNTHAALKEGGQLFVTDFCKGKASLSEEFTSYLDDCHYHLEELDGYVESLKAAGFKQVRMEDITDRFIESLKAEQERLEKSRNEFLKEFDPEDYEYLMTRWGRKIRFCFEGDMRWGMFLARK